MNHQNERTPRKWKFSLSHLLTLTALAAFSVAITIAYRKNEALTQSRAALLSLSSRLNITDKDKLTHVALPRVTENFETWEVHVPQGPPMELRLGIGEVSESEIPSDFDRAPLPAGRHRITLHAVVSHDNERQFVVYIDGKQVIDKTPGPDWMPSGWSSSHGLSWPREPNTKKQTTLQLAGKRYTSRIDFGKMNYFSGSDDKLVTSPGYRLWIDLPGRTYEPASPFHGFEVHAHFRGIGLRDGLRYKTTGNTYELAFTRPKSRVNDPVLRIIPEFIVNNRTVLSSQAPAFRSWQPRISPTGNEPFRWTKNPTHTAYTAFLHADFTTDAELKPVIELKWDAHKPHSVGMRLAKTPANEQITLMRLRFIDGTKHLWRIVNTGAEKLDARKRLDDESSNPSGVTTLDIKRDNETEMQINWQTDQSLPLQIVQRNRATPNPYRGFMSLYDGLPLKFGARIPKSLAPSISVTRINEHPTTPDTPFPGGAVFGEIQIELKANQEDWIWLQAEDHLTTP